VDVVFKGFQSTLPVWLLLAFFVASVCLAWWSYKNISIARFYRYLLISLRSIVFFILLILLAAPFFTRVTTSLERPEILVFFDNSASTAIQKGTYDGAEAYRNLLNSLAFQNQEDIQFSFFTVDDSVRNQTADSLKMQGTTTNLSTIFNTLRSHENVRTAVLISDGIYTQGRNPLYQITSSDIPIQTIALGDTSSQKDIFIKNIVANNTGYLNTAQPVEVTVVQNGFSGQNFRVQLEKDGNVLETKTLSLDENSASETVRFDIKHKQTGLQQFEIVIPTLKEEWTPKNNKQSFSIDVLDNKQRILSLAFEIHPDVRLIRSLLAQDKNTALYSRTWLGNDRFIEGPPDFGADSLDLIILHGYPQTGLSRQTKENVARYLKEVPSIIMATPQISYLQLQSDVDTPFPVATTNGTTPNKVTPAPSVQPNAHPIMDLPELSDTRLSALFAPTQGITLAPGAEMLFESRFQGNLTSAPLVAIQQTGNLRRAQITAFGWYKIRQSSQENARDFVEQLLLNTVSWTATKPDTRNLTITPSQKTFENSDTIILNGFLIDERGQKESEAQIEIQLSGENIGSNNYSMQSLGEGQYSLAINPLPEGVYTFNAVAKKGDRTIGRHKGQFAVTTSNEEFINTKRNDELLRGLAQKTGGIFYEADQAKELWKDLEQKKMLTEIERVNETLFYPNQHLFWFIIVILLLGTEWGIRKYLSLP